MTLQAPEPVDDDWADVEPVCPDCGGPIEDGPVVRLCRGCYDAYVENAGR